jgi:predicted phage-related endonuclease
MKLIEKIISIVVLLSFAFGTYFFIDNRYASADSVKQVEQRLDYKINSDQRDQIQNQMWKLEDRYKDVDKMPKDVKDNYRDLQNRKQKLDESLKTQEKK